MRTFHYPIYIAIAVVIAAASLIVSHFLVKDLAQEERNRMEIWAEAMRTVNMADENTDLNLVLKILEQNNTIPVIVTDAEGNVQTYRNITIHAKDAEDSMAVAAHDAEMMREHQQAIKVQLGNKKNDYLLVCYDDSTLLTRLVYYPYIQLAVVLLFVIIAVIALLASKKAEQNKVWVGLSKETAHQLGTPISSLMAWTEILREQYPEDELIPEMDKDVKRLQLIADRFSKIGSKPERKDASLQEILGHIVDYMNRRTSKKVLITAYINDVEVSQDSTKGESMASDIVVNVNQQLFEWVFENLCKNAVDAMEGKGSITIRALCPSVQHASGLKDISSSQHISEAQHVVIDVADTGKGIERKNIKNVFRPGFTTKKRGWGLGLSLAKRIIEEYHDGRIYVLASEIGKGTTFRIELGK